MKKLMILIVLFASFSVSSQNQKNTKDVCLLNLNRASLLSMDLDCKTLKDKKIAFFKMKVPKQPTISVKGNEITAEAKNLINKAKTGDNIVLFDIKLLGSEKEVSPVIITLVK